MKATNPVRNGFGKLTIWWVDGVVIIRNCLIFDIMLVKVIVFGRKGGTGNFFCVAL